MSKHKRAKSEPKFKDTQVGILFDVTLSVPLEVAFDKQPSEEELRLALLDNFQDMLENVLSSGTASSPDYLSYEFVDAH